MTNKYLDNKWTEEDLELARFISRSRNWPELTGEKQEVDCATVKRYGFEDKLEWERPLLRLYGDIYINFEHWLFFGEQANTKFWCNLKSIEDALMAYLKETSVHGNPSEEDIKKFDAVMSELKKNSDLPEMWVRGPEAWIPQAEKIRKEAQIDFEAVAKKAFLDGIITLEEVKEIHHWEFFENTCSDEWFLGWSMAGAIVTLHQIQENKRTGKWEK